MFEKLSRSLPGALLAALIFTGATPAVIAAEKAPTVPANPLLLSHSNFFKPIELYELDRLPGCAEKIAPLAYRAYSAVGFNLANTILLVGPDGGIVVVDALGSDGTAKAALEVFRQKEHLPPGKLPIKAVIYTHNHIDHTGGVQGVLALADRPVCPAETEAQAGQDGTFIGREDCVEILAQKEIVKNVINTATVVGDIINARSSYMYGSWIGDNRINDGIGPGVIEGSSTFQMPSRTFTDELLVAAAGINMKLFYVPSETEDELSVFLPDGINQRYRAGARASAPETPTADGWGGPGMLLSAEVIQGPSFPNLYSLRGTAYRSPAQWFRSVDKLRQYDSWAMVPAHGVPLCGAADIRLLLRNFRDAIQFTHDQAVRHINAGKTPEELAEIIHLPDYLVNDLAGMKTPKPDVHTEDYLRPFYGSVPQAVRELYFGYLGWFNADPVALQPTPPRQLAGKTVQMMGGGAHVVETAAGSLAKGRKLEEEGIREKDEAKLRAANAELEWAAELTTQVIRAAEGEPRGRAVELCRDLRSKLGGHSPSDQCRNPAKTAAPATAAPCYGAVPCRAREVKAAAFLAMAELPSNPNWRNWYISSARELCGDFTGMPPVAGGLTAPAIVTALPPGAWVNSWTMRLKAEKTAPQGPNAQCPDQGGPGVHAALVFRFEDPADAARNQSYGLRIRCAIAEFSELSPAVGKGSLPAEWKDAPVLTLSQQAWTQLLTGVAESVVCREREPFLTALQKGIADGGIQVGNGTPAAVETFFGYFDPPLLDFQALTLR
jgi:alkyl sulfatase BDS1-like metallo-beta-lactamase superfamily hydrolase